MFVNFSTLCMKGLNEQFISRINPLSATPHKMVKHTLTIHRQHTAN